MAEFGEQIGVWFRQRRQELGTYDNRAGKGQDPTDDQDIRSDSSHGRCSLTGSPSAGHSLPNPQSRGKTYRMTG
jgi:hypothetical protein